MMIAKNTRFSFTPFEDPYVDDAGSATFMEKIY